MEQDLNNWFTFLAMALSGVALWIALANRREDHRLGAMEVLGRIEKKRITSQKFFTQARRRAQTIIDNPTSESRDGLKDVATEWLEGLGDIERNHDKVDTRTHFDPRKLKVLESNLDSLLERTASFLECT